MTEEDLNEIRAFLDVNAQGKNLITIMYLIRENFDVPLKEALQMARKWSAYQL